MPIGIICNPFQLEFLLATYYKFLLPQNEKRIYQTRALPLIMKLSPCQWDQFSGIVFHIASTDVKISLLLLQQGLKYIQ